MSYKRILVTGGAEFIGFHLCEKLLSQGHEVICLDNLFTGRKENIRHLMGNPNFEFLRYDVLEPIYVEYRSVIDLAKRESPHPPSPKGWFRRSNIFGHSCETENT